MTKTPSDTPEFEGPSLAVVPHVPEISRTASLQRVREDRRYAARFSATPAECLALAKRYEVLAVNDLSADIVLKTTGPDLYRFTGRITAEIVQECGITLEPVTQRIDEEHEELLTTSADQLTPIEDMTPDIDSPTEIIEGDAIDYGEIVAQIVALAIDPFPRRPGALPLEHIEYNTSPFAALQKLQAGTATPDTPANDQDED